MLCTTARAHLLHMPPHLTSSVAPWSQVRHMTMVRLVPPQPISHFWWEGPETDNRRHPRKVNKRFPQQAVVRNSLAHCSRCYWRTARSVLGRSSNHETLHRTYRVTFCVCKNNDLIVLGELGHVDTLDVSSGYSGGTKLFLRARGLLGTGYQLTFLSVSTVTLRVFCSTLPLPLLFRLRDLCMQVSFPETVVDVYSGIVDESVDELWCPWNVQVRWGHASPGR